MLIIAAAVAATVVTGCVEGSAKTYSYTLEFTVTGSTGNHLDVTVRDETSETDLVADTDVETPWTHTLSGDINHSAPRVISVSAEVTDLGDGEAFSVEAVYTEKSYADPVQHTVIDETEENSTGSANDFEITRTLTLPHFP